MSTAESKNYVDARNPEERRWLAQYLWESERQQDKAALAGLDERMDDLAGGRNAVPWTEAAARLDTLDRRER